MGGAISALAFPAPEYPRGFYEHELLKRPDYVEITTSRAEKIPAIHKRMKDIPEDQRLTILYSHGNAEDLGLILPVIDALAQATKCDVLAYDYVGYSISKLEGGAPSEAGCLRSIDAAWCYLVEREKIPPKRIILFGRSIGSGPTVDLASRATVEGLDRSTPANMVSPLDARGVLLQSPIASGARALGLTKISMIGAPFDIFKNYQKVNRITAPVAITHGTNDNVVQFENGQDLHGMCQQAFAPVWMRGYGHNDMPQDEVLAYANRFISALRQGGENGPYDLRDR